MSGAAFTRLVAAACAVTLTCASHAQNGTPDSDPQVKAAFSVYERCVMSNATLMAGNGRESAGAIAEVAEVRCTDRRAAVVTAVKRANGSAPQPYSSGELGTELRAAVIKKVTGEIMLARQRVAVGGASEASPLASSENADAEFRVVCEVTRGDGVPWGSQMRVTVAPRLNLVDYEPAQIGPRLITWERTPAAAKDTVALSLDRETGEIFAHFKGTTTVFFRGSCQRDRTFGVRRF